MAKPPSIAELGNDLLAASLSTTEDAAALAAMVRGREQLYAAATEALRAIQAVAAGAIAPSAALTAPAVETVQRHAVSNAGQRVPDAELDAAARRMVPGGSSASLLIASGALIAASGPLLVVVSTSSASSQESMVLLYIGAMTLLIVGFGLVALGFWTRRAAQAPQVQSRTDVHTLVRTALDAGRSLGARAPGVGPQTMLRHLPEGLAYWMVHSVALERAAAGDQMHQDGWHAWHAFAAQLAMAVWVVALAAGEPPPAIAVEELSRGPFNRKALEEGDLYILLGAFNANLDSAPSYDRELLRQDTVPRVLGVGLVALSGGLGGVRRLMQGG